MKKILIITILLMLSLIASAQMKHSFNEISETEIYIKGVNTMIDQSQICINTMEGYVQKFDTAEFRRVLSAMETGNIDKYMQYLRDLGEKRFVDEANTIKSMLWAIRKSKLYFISNAKLYVITYSTKKNNYNPIVYGTHYDSLYLFRRDADGWKIASDLIRTDNFQWKEFMRRFDSRTTRWNESDTLYTLENQCFGEVHKIASGSVFVTFSTEIWYPMGEGYTYSSILVFVPDPINKETYHVSLFEPENKVGKVLKNVINHDYSWTKHTWSTSSVTALFPVLSGIRNTEYLETPEGLTIKYWDGNTDNPILAGSVNFKIVDGGVFIDTGTTIALNKLK